MKIFIQGRKGGYNALHPKPTPPEFFKFAADIQRIDAQNNSKNIGKSFYSIAFNDNGSIYTKYIIAYDTIRGNVGNIGISIFLPNNQKMSGSDIKNLLDELINTYTTNYCPDFKLNNSKREDWELFNSTANKFDSKVRSFSYDENFQRGKKEAAYIFYNNPTEIEKYIDNPYQEEYKDYKQILLIEKQSKLLQEVIKHDPTANLTSDIDLDNPCYILRNYDNQSIKGISIEIRANGKLIHNRQKIYKKDHISIKYSKKYYKDIIEEGKLTDHHLNKYLNIHDNSIEVTKKTEFDPTEVKIKISIINSKGESITDAIIDHKNNNTNNKENCNKVGENEYVFIGEVQKDRWTITAKKDSLKGEITFVPKTEEIVKLTLKEVKTVNLEIRSIGGDRISCEDLVFYDDDIRKEQTKQINIKGYETKKHKFIPANIHDNISVFLTTNKQEVEDEPTFDPPRNHTLKKIFRLSIWIISLSAILGLGGWGAVAFEKYFTDNNNLIQAPQPKKSVSKPNTDKPNTDKLVKRIKEYVEGDSLILKELNSFKEDLSNVKGTMDDSTYKENVNYIEKAIKKREAIKEGKFDFFNQDTGYSKKQQKFKTAVLELNKKDDKEFKKKLVKDVSTFTLNQIADKINKFLESKNKTKKKKAVPKNGEETEIIEYLKSDEIKLTTLKKHLNSKTSQNLKKSITLAQKFWDLNGEEGNSYYSFKIEVNNNDYLKDNQTLKNLFLEVSKTKGKKILYPKTIGGNKTKSLKQITTKLLKK